MDLIKADNSGLIPELEVAGCIRTVNCGMITFCMGKERRFASSD